MFGYIVEIMSIVVSIKILSKIENFLKDKGFFSINNVVLDFIVKSVWWWAVFLVMLIVWTILASIFGYVTNKVDDWVGLILSSSVNGFSSRCYGKFGYWIMAILSFIMGFGIDNKLFGIIVAMMFFFATRYYNDSNTNSNTIESESLDIKDEKTATDNLELLNFYLLKAKELTSEALNEFQNNNINNAIEKWNKSLEYYKTAEEIAKSHNDEELVSSIHNNIKSNVKNILNARINLISNKLRGQP